MTPRPHGVTWTPRKAGGCERDCRRAAPPSWSGSCDPSGEPGPVGLPSPWEVRRAGQELPWGPGGAGARGFHLEQPPQCWGWSSHRRSSPPLWGETGARSPSSRRRGQPPQHTDQEKSRHKTSPSPATVQPRSKESVRKGCAVTAPGSRAGESPEFSTLTGPLSTRSGVCRNGWTGCPRGPRVGASEGNGRPIEEEAGAARPPQEEALPLTWARANALPCPSSVA